MPYILKKYLRAAYWMSYSKGTFYGTFLHGLVKRIKKGPVVKEYAILQRLIWYSSPQGTYSKA